MDPVSWSDIAERLARAHHYWLHTTNADGRPDASPVWGVVRDEVAYFYTARTTVKARNAANDPRALIHLESAADVVIVHGRLIDLGLPVQHPQVLGAFEEKYQQPEEVPFLPSSDPSFDVLYSFAPARAMLWALPDTEASTRRWKARHQV
jgi:hypothetical protein